MGQAWRYGQVKVPQILRFPNNDGFLFNNSWAKTVRDCNSNIFGITRNPQSNICPVLVIERYTGYIKKSIRLVDLPVCRHFTKLLGNDVGIPEEFRSFWCV